MSTAGELLDIDPLELKFAFELRKLISCSLQLTNKSDDCIAFKVKTTNPKKYCVRPNTGIVLPRSTCSVVVTMQMQREAPPDLQCKDKFLVQSVVVSSGTSVKDITAEMFNKDSGNKVEEVKLRVVYVSPPQPPSPVPEESEEGSSPRASQESGNELETVKESTVAGGEYVESQDNLQEDALITKLRDEKAYALQQNMKLRQELDLMRKEGGRQGGTFSLVFVVLIALIGILLGYVMRK